jgi:hypothetical protein
MLSMPSFVRGSLLMAAVAFAPIAAAGAQAQQFIPKIIISSTIPTNGDVNPYGVAFVPPGFPTGGMIAPGDILVSNFNNAPTTANPTGVQGMGTTIIKLTPNGVVTPPPSSGTTAGNATTFFTSSAIGLTTALGVLRRGFVLVGNVPTDSSGTIQQGSLQVIDQNGTVVTTLIDQLNLDDPWDLTIVDNFDHATVFVSNVNNGMPTNTNGSVTRLNLRVSPTGVSLIGNPIVIANGYTVELSSSALVLGPTGVALDRTTDTLYVASTADNAIFAVPHASTRSSPPGTGTGRMIAQNGHLFGPLALVLAPNGDLVTANGDAVLSADPNQPSEIVELTKTGKFVGQFNLSSAQGGAFGLAIALVGPDDARLAAVNDVTNEIMIIDQDVVPGG